MTPFLSIVTGMGAVSLDMLLAYIAPGTETDGPNLVPSRTISAHSTNAKIAIKLANDMMYIFLFILTLRMSGGAHKLWLMFNRRFHRTLQPLRLF
jgi:hypothetical protein